MSMKILKRKLATFLGAAVVGLGCGDSAMAGPIGWTVGLISSPAAILLGTVAYLGYDARNELKLGKLHVLPTNSDFNILKSTKSINLSDSIKDNVEKVAKNAVSVAGNLWEILKSGFHVGDEVGDDNPTIKKLFFDEVITQGRQKQVFDLNADWMRGCGRERLINAIDKRVECCNDLTPVRKSAVKSYWKALLASVSDETLVEAFRGALVSEDVLLSVDSGSGLRKGIYMNNDNVEALN